MSAQAHKKDNPIVVAVSGGFDPSHVGHIRMIREAKNLGDRLVVILNNDHWLKKKKGYAFMSQEERKELLEAIVGVDEVIVTNHKENPDDMSISEELLLLRPHIFANGGDRRLDNIPEVAVCSQIQCRMIFNVGRGGKLQSSSSLVERATRTNGGQTIV